MLFYTLLANFLTLTYIHEVIAVDDAGFVNFRCLDRRRFLSSSHRNGRSQRLLGKSEANNKSNRSDGSTNKRDAETKKELDFMVQRMGLQPASSHIDDKSDKLWKTIEHDGAAVNLDGTPSKRRKKPTTMLKTSSSSSLQRMKRQFHQKQASTMAQVR
jgi:hypothetical protein